MLVYGIMYILYLVTLFSARKFKHVLTFSIEWKRIEPFSFFFCLSFQYEFFVVVVVRFGLKLMSKRPLSY